MLNSFRASFTQVERGFFSFFLVRYQGTKGKKKPWALQSDAVIHRGHFLASDLQTSLILSLGGSAYSGQYFSNTGVGDH